MGLLSSGMMSSITVKEREVAARDFVATLQMHGRRVSGMLAELFEPLLEEDEELPDYLLLQRLMARAVRGSLATLLAADEAHQKVLEQIEAGDLSAEQGPFLQARRTKTEADRQQAIEVFDETYIGFAQLLEALYGLVGEEEIAERLRPRVLDDDIELPEPALAEVEISEPPDDGGDEDQIARRILSRRGRHPGLSRWLGYRIFRRRPARR